MTLGKTISNSDKNELRKFSIRVRMTRENHKRIYLEHKKKNWRDSRKIRRLLERHIISYSNDTVRENKGRHRYYRQRIYVFGAEAMKVLDLIDWDFKNEQKNNKVKAIRGLYNLGRI